MLSAALTRQLSIPQGEDTLLYTKRPLADR